MDNSTAGCESSGWKNLLSAIAGKNHKILNRLLKKKENQSLINTVHSPTGNSLLHIAVETGCVETTCVLLRAGADPNHPTKTGLTPLMVAISRNREENSLEMVACLLEYGADPNKANSDGLTPLVSAIVNNPRVIQILVASGSSLSKSNNLGVDPKVLAKKMGMTDSSIRQAFNLPEPSRSRDDP